MTNGSLLDTVSSVLEEHIQESADYAANPPDDAKQVRITGFDGTLREFVDLLKSSGVKMRSNIKFDRFVNEDGSLGLRVLHHPKKAKQPKQVVPLGPPGQIVFDNSTGFFYREGTTHLDTIKEPPREYAPLTPGPDDRILDIGGHVGGFMGWAFSRGTRTVWTVEPAPDTFEVLQKNAALRQQMDPTADIRIFNAAAVADPAPETIELWMTKNHRTKASSMASVQHARGRESVVVKAVSFRRLIEELQPTAIKVDIEGGEYFLNFDDLPSCVRKIAFELHWVNRAKEKAKALHIAETVEAQGFKEVITGTLGKPFREKLGWNWQVVFTR